MKVLNLGSLNIDYLYSVKDFPKPGETISSTDYIINPGGKGLNQSVALARAGVEVYHIGKIGKNDIFLKDILEKNNVKTDYLQTDGRVSGHANICVTEYGENNIVLYPGANYEITEELIDEALKIAEEGDIFLMQNETSMVPYAAKKAKEKGMKTFLNAAPIDKKLDELDFKYIDVISINEIEGYELTGKTGATNVHNFLKGFNKDIELLLTVGKNGSVFYDGNISVKTGIFEVDIVDTTAAGDTYIGYFIAGMIEGDNIEVCMVRAAKASALAISKKGAAISIPTRKDLESIDLVMKK